MTTTTTTQPAATYVRHTIERLTEATRGSGQDSIVWAYIHLLSVITELDIAGHGEAVRAAVDRCASFYELPSQISQNCEVSRSEQNDRPALTAVQSDVEGTVTA